MMSKMPDDKAEELRALCQRRLDQLRLDDLRVLPVLRQQQESDCLINDHATGIKVSLDRDGVHGYGWVTVEQFTPSGVTTLYEYRAKKSPKRCVAVTYQKWDLEEVAYVPIGTILRYPGHDMKKAFVAETGEEPEVVISYDPADYGMWDEFGRRYE